MKTRKTKSEAAAQAPKSKAKKLQLDKETLKDLALASEKDHNVRGGNKTQCSMDATGC